MVGTNEGIKMSAYYCTLYFKILNFLYNEAKLLDSRQFLEWISLFADDARYIIYAIPTVKKGQNDQRIILSHDNKSTLMMKMRRLTETYSWSENPYSRTIRVVSNVMINDVKNNLVNVSSNILLIKNRNGISDYIVARRTDILLFEGENIKIKHREVELIEYPLPYKNVNLPL
jgi:3-phenylpropionate/cinnamic acid dioxygenase small subunit